MLDTAAVFQLLDAELLVLRLEAQDLRAFLVQEDVCVAEGPERVKESQNGREDFFVRTERAIKCEEGNSTE